MAAKLLRSQFEMKINLKMGSRDQSPDASSVCSQGSTNTSSKGSLDWNLLCDRIRKPEDTMVQFYNNENVTVIELCAKNVKPLPRPKTAKKPIPKDTYSSSLHSQMAVVPHNTVQTNSLFSSQRTPSTHSRRGLRSKLIDPAPSLLPGYRRKRKQSEVNGCNEVAKCLKLDVEQTPKLSENTINSTVLPDKNVAAVDISFSNGEVSPPNVEVSKHVTNDEDVKCDNMKCAAFVTSQLNEEKTEISPPMLIETSNSILHKPEKPVNSEHVEKELMELSSSEEKSSNPTDNCGASIVDASLCPTKDKTITQSDLSNHLNSIIPGEGKLTEKGGSCAGPAANGAAFGQTNFEDSVSSLKPSEDHAFSSEQSQDIVSCAKPQEKTLESAVFNVSPPPADISVISICAETSKSVSMTCETSEDMVVDTVKSKDITVSITSKDNKENDETAKKYEVGTTASQGTEKCAEASSRQDKSSVESTQSKNCAQTTEWECSDTSKETKVCPKTFEDTQASKHSGTHTTTSVNSGKCAEDNLRPDEKIGSVSDIAVPETVHTMSEKHFESGTVSHNRLDDQDTCLDLPNNDGQSDELLEKHEVCAQPCKGSEKCPVLVANSMFVQPAADSMPTKESADFENSSKLPFNETPVCQTLGSGMSAQPFQSNAVPAGSSVTLCSPTDDKVELFMDDSRPDKECLSKISEVTKSNDENCEGEIKFSCEKLSSPKETESFLEVSTKEDMEATGHLSTADALNTDNMQITPSNHERFNNDLSTKNGPFSELLTDGENKGTTLKTNESVVSESVCTTKVSNEKEEQKLSSDANSDKVEKAEEIAVDIDQTIEPANEDAIQPHKPTNTNQDEKCDNSADELTSVKSSAVALVPSVNLDVDAVLSDVSSLKKLIPEVCACDTTTGSTDDELSAGKPVAVAVEKVLPPMSDVTLPSFRTDFVKPVRLSSKRSRRQWAKELTKIRVKMNERKRMARHAGLVRARQTRRKFLEAKKASNVTNKQKNVDSLPAIPDPLLENDLPIDITGGKTAESVTAVLLSGFESETVNAPVEKQSINKMDANSQFQEECPTVCCNVGAEKIVKNSTDNVEVTDNIQNMNNSSNGGFESIEVVDDEVDDEDPWPFVTSPSQPSNVPTPTSACSQKSMVSPTPSLGSESTPAIDEPPTESENLDAQDRTSSIPFEPTLSIDNILPCEVNNKASDCINELDEPSPNQEKSPPEGDEPLVFCTPKENSISSESASTSGTCIEVEKSPMNSEESCYATPESSPRKKELDHIQHAKMHSRSAEVQRTNSLTDSLWKNMFNSEVPPLDFDDAATAKLKQHKNQLLPAVFQKSQEIALLSQEKRTVDVSQTEPTFVNTPCGDTYPIAQSDVSEPITASTLKLCSCKLNSSPLSQNKKKSGSQVSYCQAVETVGTRISNCMSRISDKTEGRRASSNLPFMTLCKVHRKKLSQHTCCPVCGLFCAGGAFIDCMSGRGHLHHSTCQVKGEDGAYLCPHCGEKSSQVSVNIPLKNDLESQRTKKVSKKQNQEGIARMCIRLVTKPTVSSGTDNSNLSYDNKLFEVSKSTLLDGAAKTKLITILSSLEHLVPAMQEKLSSSRVPIFTLHDLSSSIFKNDLSQLTLGICELMNKSNSDALLTLNKPFAEHEGKTLLHLAVQTNSLATVHCLVMAGVEVNTADTKGVSPLMLAAKSNQIDVVKYLIGAGAWVEWRDVDGMTSLHFAAVAGNKSICEYLLREVDANIDCVDDGGWTPLVWAIENGHSHVVKLLLNSEACIHKRDAEGNACIHWGAYSGNTEIIKLLINRGADIEAVNELGDRPLHIAVKQARTDAVILLLSHGADTTAINNLYQTPAECCHGACSENMRSFLTVNGVLRSCRIGDVATRSSRLLQQDIARGKEKVPIPVTNDIDNSNYPTGFTYVTESVWTTPVPINTMISSLSRCNCLGDCTRASCACARSSISCWYEMGSLSSSFDFTNPPQIFECNKACGCWATCSNRVVQQGITAQLELFKTKGRGWGVKARHEIAKGTFVCEYVGELITDSEADQREDDSYLFDLDCKDGDTYCMDAKHYGNISRFINHRCEPNLTPVNVFIDHQDVRFPRICLFANTDIEMGTELGFDYGEKFWLVKYKDFLCDCGCATCKYNEKTIAETLSQNQQHQTESSTSQSSL